MKKFNPLTKLAVGAAIGALSLLASKPANAALLAQYTLNTDLSNSAPATTGLSVSSFFNGRGMGAAQFSTRSVSGDSRAITYAGLTATNKATSLSSGSYYGFTLTPQNTSTTRYGTMFNSLSFSTDVGGGNLTQQGNFFVQANLGAGNTFVDVSTTYTQNATTTKNFITRTVDLTGFTAANNNGYFTQPIEFRIYQFDNANNTGGGLRVDNVQLQGQVAPVPELSTSILMLLALGGLGAMSLRRKKTGTVPMRLAI